MRKYAQAAMAAVAVALLTACGGGGGSGAGVTPAAANYMPASTGSDAAAVPTVNAVTADDVTTPDPATLAPDPTASHSPPPSASEESEERALSATAVGPAHAPTYQQLSGDFASGQSGWSNVAKYTSYVLTDKRAVKYAHNAGMKVGFYTDPIKLHGGDQNRYPANAFAHTCDGAKIYSASSGTPAFLANPGSWDLQGKWYEDQRTMLKDQYGTYPYDFVFSDDSEDPGQAYSFDIFRKNSSSGAIASNLFCGYSHGKWLSDIQNLFQNAPLPVIYNGHTSSGYYQYDNGKSRILGGECEGCIASPYLQNGQKKVTGNDWMTHMNAGLMNVANRKIFFLSADGAVNNDVRGYTYASFMLMYDQNYSLFRQSGTNTRSRLGNPPTVKIVPTQPRVPTPTDISRLDAGNGVYAREYKVCFIDGKSVGPCAALVNPDPAKSKKWPYLKREYHHLLRFGGNGAANDLGDDGWADAKGSHPGSSISAASWAIAFN